jgi:hypothetical protein
LSKKSKKNQKWGVFEFATGVLWQVNPPTKENAEKQAKAVADEGYHEVVPLKWGWHMSNAFNHGKAQERARVRLK